MKIKKFLHFGIDLNFLCFSVLFGECFKCFHFFFLLLRVSLLEFHAMFHDSFNNFLGCQRIFCSKCKFTKIRCKNRWGSKLVNWVFMWTDLYTWIKCNKFAQLLRNSIWVQNTFFQRHMSLAMADNGHIEMIHELFGNTIWCTNYDLIHILELMKNCKNLVELFEGVLLMSHLACKHT